MRSPPRRRGAAGRDAERDRRQQADRQMSHRLSQFLDYNTFCPVRTVCGLRDRWGKETDSRHPHHLSRPQAPAGTDPEAAAMAKTSEVAAQAAVPSGADIERAAGAARGPFLLEGEGPGAGALGPARRRALDGALKELDDGAETPWIQWRQDFSLLLRLERLLADEPPTLRDGAQLNPHQVDALSGTLTELMAAQQTGARNGGNRGGGGDG